MARRFKYLVMLTMVFGCGSLVLIVLYGDPQPYIRKYGGFYGSQSQQQNSGKESSIFYTNDEIREIGKTGTVKPCPAHPLLGSNTTHIWVQKENFPFYNLSTPTKIVCCYKSFYRPKSVDDIMGSKIDNRVKYNPCRNFTEAIQAKDEFVRVICNDNRKHVFDSFFLFAREKRILDKPKTDLPYNILILGIDSVSRLNLHRTMPKTVTFLNKLGVVELFRHNKVGENTFPNLIPLLIGRNVTELKEMCWPHENKFTFDSCPFTWERFQEAGFTTAYAEDYARIGTFNYNKKRGFAGSPTDYYLRTFMLEAEAYAKNKNNKTWYCINEKYIFEILLDYVLNLTAMLSKTSRKLFGIFWESTMSHDHLNDPMVMDDTYKALFKNMNTTGYLNKSIIFFVSDHGLRFGKFRKTRQGFLEDRLPFVFILMPPSFRKNFSEAYNNLKGNIHRLTTPFDVHATLSDLLNLDTIKNEKIYSRSNESYSGRRSISLFLPVPKNRTCQSAAIDAHWCVDYGNVKVDSNSSEALEAIEYAVSHLKGILKDFPQCAELSLAKVLMVSRLLSEGEKEKNNKTMELTVSFSTNPGGGEFEATLGRQGGPGGAWLMLGSVSRLNAYGNQSYCVQANPDASLSQYCYCIK